MIVEIDELWSFVDHKGNKQWVWLAIDRSTREIVGCYVGDRNPFGEGIWQKSKVMHDELISESDNLSN